MANSESATFILKTSDLPTNAAGENASGSTNNASGSSYTWKNIDMRVILGTMYDEYDNFNIGLVNSISTVQPATYTLTTNNDKLGVLYMRGLRWRHSNYDCGSKSVVDNACIGYVNFSSLSTTVGTNIQYNTLNLNTFAKPHPIINLTIFFNRVSDNASNTLTAGAYPQMAFQFVVYPIINKKIEEKKEEKKEGSVNHRIIK